MCPTCDQMVQIVIPTGALGNMTCKNTCTYLKLLESFITPQFINQIKPFSNYSKVILLLNMSRNFPYMECIQWLSYLFSWDICQRDGGSVGICVHSNPKRCRSTHNSNRKLRNC